MGNFAWVAEHSGAGEAAGEFVSGRVKAPPRVAGNKSR